MRERPGKGGEMRGKAAIPMGLSRLKAGKNGVIINYFEKNAGQKKKKSTSPLSG